MNILRHVRIPAVVAAGILIGAVGGALGQAGWNQILSPLGTEAVQTFVNASAYQNYVTINQIRNTTGYQLTAATTGTVNTTTATDNLIFTAAATTVTVNLPPNPPDGQIFSLNNGTSSNFVGTITVATTDGSTIANGAAATNLGSAGSQEWQWTAASKIWYRLR